MDWPISWQKVKDNGGGYEILDPVDYGLGFNEGASHSVQGTLMLDDMALVIKSGKSIVLRVALGETSGLDADTVLLPAVYYAFDQNGDLIDVACYTRILAFGDFIDATVHIYRSPDGKKIESLYWPSIVIPEATGTLGDKYVLTSRDGKMSWELGDYLLDLSIAAVAVGNTTSIDGMAIQTLNKYSEAGKNLTAKFKFIDPTDSENEVTQVVGLNLMVTHHTTHGTMTTAYVGTAAGMFFNVYEEDAHWLYSVTQQS